MGIEWLLQVASGNLIKRTLLYHIILLLMNPCHKTLQYCHTGSAHAHGGPPSPCLHMCDPVPRPAINLRNRGTTDFLLVLTTVENPGGRKMLKKWKSRLYITDRKKKWSNQISVSFFWKINKSWSWWTKFTLLCNLLLKLVFSGSDKNIEKQLFI